MSKARLLREWAWKARNMRELAMMEKVAEPEWGFHWAFLLLRNFAKLAGSTGKWLISRVTKKKQIEYIWPFIKKRSFTKTCKLISQVNYILFNIFTGSESTSGKSYLTRFERLLRRESAYQNNRKHPDKNDFVWVSDKSEFKHFRKQVRSRTVWEWRQVHPG